VFGQEATARKCEGGVVIMASCRRTASYGEREASGRLAGRSDERKMSSLT